MSGLDAGTAKALTEKLLRPNFPICDVVPRPVAEVINKWAKQEIDDHQIVLSPVLWGPIPDCIPQKSKTAIGRATEEAQMHFREVLSATCLMKWGFNPFDKKSFNKKYFRELTDFGVETGHLNIITTPLGLETDSSSSSEDDDTTSTDEAEEAGAGATAEPDTSFRLRFIPMRTTLLGYAALIDDKKSLTALLDALAATGLKFQDEQFRYFKPFANAMLCHDDLVNFEKALLIMTKEQQRQFLTENKRHSIEALRECAFRVAIVKGHLDPLIDTHRHLAESDLTTPFGSIWHRLMMINGMHFTLPHLAAYHGQRAILDFLRHLADTDLCPEDQIISPVLATAALNDQTEVIKDLTHDRDERGAPYKAKLTGESYLQPVVNQDGEELYSCALAAALSKYPDGATAIAIAHGPDHLLETECAATHLFHKRVLEALIIKAALAAETISPLLKTLFSMVAAKHAAAAEELPHSDLENSEVLRSELVNATREANTAKIEAAQNLAAFGDIKAELDETVRELEAKKVEIEALRTRVAGAELIAEAAAPSRKSKKSKKKTTDKAADQSSRIADLQRQLGLEKAKTSELQSHDEARQESHRHALAERDQVIAELRTALQAQAPEIIRLQKIAKEAQQQQSARDDRESLLAANKKLTTENSGLKTRLSELNKACAENKKRICLLDKSIARERSETASKVELLSDALKAGRDKASTYQAESNRLTLQVVSLREEIATKDRAINNLTQRLLKPKAPLPPAYPDLRAELARSQQQVVAFSLQLQKTAEGRRTEEIAYGRLASQNQRLAETIAKQKQQISELGAALASRALIPHRPIASGIPGLGGALTLNLDYLGSHLTSPRPEERLGSSALLDDSDEELLSPPRSIGSGGSGSQPIGSLLSPWLAATPTNADDAAAFSAV